MKRLKQAKHIMQKIKNFSTKKMPLPVICSPLSLPLNDSNFPWRNFESFSKAIASLKFPNSSHTYFYGKAGDKQKGIDIVIEFPKSKSIVVQCKRYGKYSVTDFKAAKAALTYKGHSKVYLFLSCEASSKLRDEVSKHKNWILWDCNDIAAFVFSLESEVKSELINSHFGPAWVDAICNFDVFNPICSPVKFFEPFINPEKIFNHCTPFYGRQADLQRLIDFKKSKEKKVFILSATGGAGKSRLLWEFTRFNDQNWNTVFVKEDMPLSSQHLKTLIADRYIFIFDDAHRFENIDKILRLITSQKSEYKIILSTRPQAQQRLRVDVKSLNLNSDEVDDYEVTSFTKDESSTFIKKQFPALPLEHNKMLADLFQECTLIGMMACNLIKQKDLVLTNLLSDKDIKETVLLKFKNEMLGRLEGNAKPEVTSRLLELVAAMSPLPHPVKPILKDLSSMSGFSEEDIEVSYSTLEAFGVLAVKGKSARIAPDVLSDCILEQGCFLPNGEASGFFEKLSLLAPGKLRLNLLRNISELDWKKRNDKAAGSVLLKSFWKKVEEDLENGESRESIINLIQPLAFFQPAESLRIMVILSKGLEPLSEDSSYNMRQINESISKISKDIILSGYGFHETFQLLWELGWKDDRNLNSNPGHPIRILQDICSYSRKFPVNFFENFVDEISIIVDSHDHRVDKHSAIVLLKGLLEKTSHSDYYDGGTIYMSPFKISVKNTFGIRTKIFNLLSKLIVSDNSARAIEAISIASRFLTPPTPVFAMAITPDDIRSWDTEVTRCRDLLLNSFDEGMNIVVKLEIKNALKDFVESRHYSNLKNVCKVFLESHQITEQEIKYTLVSHVHFNRLIVGRLPYDWSKRQKITIQKLRTKLRKYISSEPTTRTFLDSIQFVSEQLSSARINPDIGLFAYHASEDMSMKGNLNLVRSLLDFESHILLGEVNHFMVRFSADRPIETKRLILKCLNHPSISALRSISRVFALLYLNTGCTDEVSQIFDSLLCHEDIIVKNNAVLSLRYLRDKKDDLYCEFLKKVSALDDTTVTALATNVDERFGLKPSLLSDTDLAILLAKFESAKRLDEYQIQQFLLLCAERIPLNLIDLFVNRIFSKSERPFEFRPLPYERFHKPLNIPREKLPQILDKIVASFELVDKEHFHWISELFRMVHSQELELSRDLITKLISTKDANKIKVASHLIAGLSRGVIMSDPQWIVEVLTLCKTISDEVYEEINGAFYRRLSIYSSGGTIGEPSAKDLEMLDFSTKALNKFKVSCAVELFNDLKEHAETMINHSKSMKREDYFDDEDD